MYYTRVPHISRTTVFTEAGPKCCFARGRYQVATPGPSPYDQTEHWSTLRTRPARLGCQEIHLGLLSGAKLRKERRSAALPFRKGRAAFLRSFRRVSFLLNDFGNALYLTLEELWHIRVLTRHALPPPRPSRRTRRGKGRPSNGSRASRPSLAPSGSVQTDHRSRGQWSLVWRRTKIVRSATVWSSTRDVSLRLPSAHLGDIRPACQARGDLSPSC